MPMTQPSAGQPEASDSESEVKAEPKPEATSELNSTVKAEPMHEAKAKTPTDLTRRIAKRAYELYEEGGRKEGAAVQNWENAESEIRQDQAKAEPPHETKAVPKAEMTSEPQAETLAETPSDMPPHLIQRVHRLYEELGRQDVRAVQDWEKVQGEIGKERSAK